MKRNAINRLIHWKEAGDERPALLYGAKGCGKTWLALDFAKSFFEGSLYVNLETDAHRKQQLEDGCRTINGHDELLQLFSKCFDVPTALFPAFLLILDEICCSELLLHTVIQYTPCYILLVSSRKMPVETSNEVEPIFLAPLQFDEFLTAIGSEWYAEIIHGHYQTRHRIPTIVHKELLDLFEDYLAIGGMPAAVNEYLQTESIENIPEIHRRIVADIQYHIRHAYEESLALRMLQILEVMPMQLLKDNQKFQYKLIRKGATYQMYRDALQTLENELLIYPCCKHGDEAGSFKLFPMDVGIYHSVLQYPGEEERVLANIRPGKFFFENENPLLRKDILDCYVMQALIAKEHEICFWESSSQAKIDFLLNTEDGTIPIEIKSTESSRSRSISIYRNETGVPYSIRLASGNYEITEQQRCLPYYSLFCL